MMRKNIIKIHFIEKNVNKCYYLFMQEVKNGQKNIKRKIFRNRKGTDKYGRCVGGCAKFTSN